MNSQALQHVLFGSVVALAFFVSGCQVTHVSFPEPIRQDSGPVQVEKPAFVMRPSVLEKTTIFMKRSAEKYGATDTGVGRHALPVITNSDEWIPLGSYRVVVHVENLPLEKILNNVLLDAAPYVGPWQVKWSLPKEYEDILFEKFSLDTETEFSQFISYLKDYILNYRGINVTFELYEAERIMVVKG